jgi:hypothetical protein
MMMKTMRNYTTPIFDKCCKSQFKRAICPRGENSMPPGRPKNPDRTAQQKARRFIPLEKTPETERLMSAAHAAYVRVNGRDTSDAEVLRDALRTYRG